MCPFSKLHEKWEYIISSIPLPHVVKFEQIVHWMQVNTQCLWSFIPSLLPLSLAAVIEHNESVSFFLLSSSVFHLTVRLLEAATWGIFAYILAYCNDVFPGSLTYTVFSSLLSQKSTIYTQKLAAAM